MEFKTITRDSEVLTYPFCIHRRKGMYLPNIDYMVREIVDNSVDEFSLGNCNTIIIDIDIENYIITIADNGSGIPVEKSKEYPELTKAEVNYTTLHAGGNFSANSSGVITATGGINGVGASSVAALSEWLYLMSTPKQGDFKGQTWRCKIEEGIITENMKHIPSNKAPRYGTAVKFKISKKFWNDDEDILNLEAIRDRLDTLAYLNPGLKFIFNKEILLHVDGLKEMANNKLLNLENKDVLNVYQASKSFSIANNDITLPNRLAEFNMCMEITQPRPFECYSFCNNITTPRHGSHVDGVKRSLLSVAKEVLKLNNKVIKNLSTEDIYNCFSCIINVKIPEPNFKSQGKDSISESAFGKLISAYVKEDLLSTLDKNPELTKEFIKSLELSMKMRLASERARVSTKEKNTKMARPEKLVTCKSKIPAECSLYIVEGDSASGTSKVARKSKIHAILGVFGKVPNVFNLSVADVRKSSKLMELVAALECDIGNKFNIENLRYHKICLLADADSDGGHINALNLFFLYKFYRPLIEAGYVYITNPPLYELTCKNKETIYFYDEEKYRAFDSKGYKIQRYKGLGEMDPKPLADSVFASDKCLTQVSIENAEEVAKAFELCFGPNSDPRKDLIVEALAKAAKECE